MEIPECHKKASPSCRSEIGLWRLKEQNFEQILSYLDINSRLEFRLASKETNKLVTIRGGWSETLMALFLPELEMEDYYEALASGKSITNSLFSLARNPLSCIKNKNNKLWFSYFRTVSLLAGPSMLGTDIDSLLQELSRSLLHQFKSKQSLLQRRIPRK